MDVNVKKAEYLFLRGTQYLQKGEFGKAVQALEESISLYKDDFRAYNHLGLAYQQLPNFSKAIECFSRAVELNKKSISGYINLATVYFNLGENDKSEKILRKGIIYNKDNPDIHYNLGLVLHKLGKNHVAEDFYRKAIELDKSHLEAHIDLSSILIDKEKYDEAILLLNFMEETYPNNFHILFVLGFLYMKQKKYDEAIGYYLCCLPLPGNKEQLYFNMGFAYQEKKDWKNADYYYTKAIELNTESLSAQLNKGVVLERLEKYDEAIECFKKVAQSKEKKDEGLLNWATTLSNKGDFLEAIKKFDETLKYTPNDEITHFNKGIALLSLEKFKEGWAEYEWRKDNSCGNPLRKSAKLWNGEPLENKTILIIEEQGIGDLFQFIRYAKLLKEQKATVILQCRKNLHSLLENSKFIDKLIAEKPIKSDYDYEISVLSLPYISGTNRENIPQNLPYIFANKEKIEEWKKKTKSKQPKIGIVWKGNSKHQNDHLRSCKIEDFEALLSDKSLKIYSLQYESNEEEEKYLKKFDVELLKVKFDDLAAIIENMDLIISVDTSMVHLVGAMDKKVWILLHKTPDWRWGANKKRTAWYKSALLFKQKNLKNWEEVFKEIEEELSKEFRKPENIDTSNKKIEALEHHQKGNFEEAEKIYLLLLKETPKDLQLIYWLGMLYKETEQNDKAAFYYKKILEREPDNSSININLGNIFLIEKEYPEAEKYYKYAYKVEPENFDIINNIGFALQCQNKLDEALTFFQKALDIKPQHYGVIGNIGNNYFLRQNFEESRKYFALAIRLNNSYIEGRTNIAFSLLLEGIFIEGWKFFKFSLFDRPELAQYKKVKYWNGEKDEGSTIYIYAEQGLGDTIQFHRFLKKVKELGFRIIFECQEKLHFLYKEDKTVDVLTSKNKKFYEKETYNYYCSLMDLPRIFQITEETIPLPVKIKYELQEELIKNVEFPKNKLKVLICWKGNCKHGNDHNRSINLEFFKDIFERKNICFYSLEPELSAEEEKLLNKFSNVTSLKVKIDMLPYIIKEVDLIITVDTMIAHLAATLEKKTWILLPFVPDWRWQLNKDETAWYPNAKLFRQNSPGNWEFTFNKLKEEIEVEKTALKYKVGQDTKEKMLEYGKSLLDKRDNVAAISIFSEIIEKDETCSEAYFSLAYSYQIEGNAIEAIKNYQKAIKIKPDYYMAYNNFGLVLKELGKFTHAKICFDTALQISPNNPFIYNNLSSVSELLGNFEEAVKYGEKAVSAKPDFLEVYLNISTAYQSLNNIPKALETINKAIEINPEYVEGHFNKSVILLKEKDFKEGLPEYEWRRKLPAYPKRKFSKPELKSNFRRGARILVYDEQAFGDTIQFTRYLYKLKERGAYLIFECHQDIFELMEGCQGIDRVISRKNFNEPKVAYDFHIPLLSLPLYFKTDYSNIDRKREYITPNTELVNIWKDKLQTISEPKVGLVWEGRMPINNMHRAANITDFTEIAELNNIQLFSLQKGIAANRDAEKMDQMNIINLNDEIKTFSDTAAIIKNLDLVITIDTAVAHLAGALGVPTWVMLSYKSDWRWFRTTEASPWYPNMKLFRQSWYGNWSNVIEKIKNELKTKY